MSERATLSHPLTVLHYHNKPADGLYESAQSAVTKPHRPSGLKIRHLLLIVLSLESPRLTCPLTWLLVDSLVLAEVGLLAVPSHSRVCVISSYKHADHIMKVLPSRSHLNLISSHSLHLQTPSHQGLGFQHVQFSSQNW